MVDGLDFDEIMRVQRMMASRVLEEQQTDNKIKVMNIINEMTTGKKDRVQKEAVLIEAQNQGLGEAQTEKILEELEEDNFIVVVGGFLKKV
ncbi:MAG: hypothetical protein MI867_09820 [Pseudomonadales bacterium]|nr:hypothetical protein [Pseudomonadales bacterium]